MSRPGMDGQTASTLSWFRDWVSNQLDGIRHERRVAAIACSLFDLTLPLHDLGRGDLRMLKLAAYLHDVGRSVQNENHAVIGADHSPGQITSIEKAATAGAGLSGPSPSRARSGCGERSA